jgi:hypothetical protein
MVAGRWSKCSGIDRPWPLSSTNRERRSSRKAIVVIVYDNRFSEQALSRVEQACEQARVDRVVIIREFPDLKHGAGK